MRLPLALLLPLATALAGVAQAQERQWSLDAGGEDAYLVFGVPDTDDVGLSLWCTIGSGSINVYVPGSHGGLAHGQQASITLKAGEQTAELTAMAEVNPEAGESSVEGAAPADFPIFKSMLASDRVRVRVNGEDNVFPLIDADLAGLLELCRKM